MSISIPLSQGKVAFVDEEDHELLRFVSWSVSRAGYAVGCVSGKNEYMHRHILNIKHGDNSVVDHINGNKLDNRRANLRITDQSSNALNSGPQQSRIEGIPSSPYKGVHWSRKDRCWCAKFRDKRLGVFASDVDAALAYDSAVLSHGDKYAYCNFPSGSSDAVSQVFPRKASGRMGALSSYLGVHLNKTKKRWNAEFSRKGIRVCWSFESEELAARAYDAIATRILGGNALLNFPGEDLMSLQPKQEQRLQKLFNERRVAA